MSNLLILDIDGTIISHDSDEKKIIYRPSLSSFLSEARKLGYTLAVWSAASKDWIEKVLSSLDEEFLFVWNGERCSRRMDHDIGSLIIRKRLKKIWKRYKKKYNRTNTLIIDDVPSTYSDNRGNALRISPYYSGEDNEFERILEILRRKIIKDDVRF